MSDAGAIALKEWRELLGQRGLHGKFGIVLFMAVFGVVLPLQAGPKWITSPAMAMAWAWAPMFLVTTVIADAFAGERERHTLETLLASRLSNGAILCGKMGAAIGYAGAVSGASLLLGVVAVNLVHARDGILFYRFPVVLSIAVLGFLGALLVAAFGTLISLRATTVRQAQQTLSGAIMVVLFVPIALVRIAPAEWTAGWAWNTVGMAVLGMGAFVALDVAVVALAVIRFERGRLIGS